MGGPDWVVQWESNDTTRQPPLRKPAGLVLEVAAPDPRGPRAGPPAARPHPPDGGRAVRRRPPPGECGQR